MNLAHAPDAPPVGGGPAATVDGSLLDRLVVTRLRDRYAAIAEGPNPDRSTPPPLRLVGLAAGRSRSQEAPRHASGPAAAQVVPNGATGIEYLASLLCFRGFEEAAHVAQIVDRLAVRWAGPGEPLIREGSRPDALLLVARGALAVTVGCSGGARRVRLAGPGRFVGHLGLLDHAPSPVAARARERSVVIELPREQVEALLRCQTGPACRFTAAVHDDLARAVQSAERVIARAAASGSTATAERSR